MFTRLPATSVIAVLALPRIVWVLGSTLQDFDKTLNDKLVMAIGSES